MGMTNVEEFRAAAAGSPAFVAWLEDAIEDLRELTAAEVLDALGDLVGPSDRKVLAGGAVPEYVAQAFRDGVAAGPWGWHDDTVSFVAPWGFEPSDITVPVSVWHGIDDRTIPVGHGHLLAATIPTAQSFLLENEGHLSLESRYGVVVDELLASCSASETI
jgi:pimeloyl-ACP methyl ester carboxylesterase